CLWWFPRTGMVLEAAPSIQELLEQEACRHLVSFRPIPAHALGRIPQEAPGLPRGETLVEVCHGQAQLSLDPFSQGEDLRRGTAHGPIVASRDAQDYPAQPMSFVDLAQRSSQGPPGRQDEGRQAVRQDPVRIAQREAGAAQSEIDGQDRTGAGQALGLPCGTTYFHMWTITPPSWMSNSTSSIIARMMKIPRPRLRSRPSGPVGSAEVTSSRSKPGPRSRTQMSRTSGFISNAKVTGSSCRCWWAC